MTGNLVPPLIDTVRWASNHRGARVDRHEAFITDSVPDVGRPRDYPMRFGLQRQPSDVASILAAVGAANVELGAS